MLVRSFIERLASMVNGVGHMGHHAHIRMTRFMHEEHEFSDLFMRFLLARSMRIQADLVNQFSNDSERRLAGILLLMAEFRCQGA